jgi:chaperone modulatory protein CbpM
MSKIFDDNRPDQRVEYTWRELTALSGLGETEIDELVAFGVLVPKQERPEWVFEERYLYLARTARRLQTDFELTLSGVALALTYLERIRELEDQLRLMECLLPKR